MAAYGFCNMCGLAGNSATLWESGTGDQLCDKCLNFYHRAVKSVALKPLSFTPRTKNIARNLMGKPIKR